MLVVQTLYKYDKMATYPQCKTVSICSISYAFKQFAIYVCTLINVLTVYKIYRKENCRITENKCNLD